MGGEVVAAVFLASDKGYEGTTLAERVGVELSEPPSFMA